MQHPNTRTEHLRQRRLQLHSTLKPILPWQSALHLTR
jgi:hypothetical protein